MVLKKDDIGLFDTMVTLLIQGGVAILPCDTIYGLVGMVPDSEQKIRKIKGSSQKKSFIQLIPSISWLDNITAFKIPQKFLDYWPGPLTLIIRCKNKQKIAFRIPEDIFLQRLLIEIKAPLFSTSVNITGQSFLRRIKQIIREFEKRVDLIVDGGDLEKNIPSTIVDLCEQPYKIIRQGVIAIPKDILNQ